MMKLKEIVFVLTTPIKYQYNIYVVVEVILYMWEFLTDFVFSCSTFSFCLILLVE
jgi:hypothetical protein